jgi:hypothetical protein
MMFVLIFLSFACFCEETELFAKMLLWCKLDLFKKMEKNLAMMAQIK